MRTFAAALAALALAAPGAGRAQPVSAVSGPDTYLELHLGAFVPQHDDVDALDTGYAFGGTFGARFTPNLGVEGELGYYRSTGEASMDGGLLSFEQTLWVLPFSASLRLRLPLKVAELSAIAGGSLAVAGLDGTFTPEGGASFGGSDTAVAFGFHVGAAAAFNLSPTMTFGVDVRRTFLTARFEGEDVGLDGLRLALTLGYHL